MPRRTETDIAHLHEDPFRHHGAVSPPIYQTSTFVFPSVAAAEQAVRNYHEAYVYTRGTNPTVQIVEAKLAALEGGEAAKCFGSGVAAVAAAILSQLKAGDHVIAVRNAYGRSHSLLSSWLSRFNVTTTLVDGSDPDEWSRAVQSNTRLFFLECPTTFNFQIQDVRAVADIARKAGAITIADNSWATPLFLSPLALGVDLVVHSATKYLSGHSDILAGVVVGRETLIRKIADSEYVLLGGICAPFEAWLLLRGLRTLPLRMAQHQRGGLEVATWLANHPRVRSVLHPGLESHPQHALFSSQFRGAAGVFGVILDTDADGVRKVLDALRLFGLGVSWGGFDSLVWWPGISIGPEQLKGLGLSPSLIRLHIGLEAPIDLIEDLESALQVLDGA